VTSVSGRTMSLRALRARRDLVLASVRIELSGGKPLVLAEAIARRSIAAT
jgi:hypothetical protein